jgi:polyhydroxyalkanoate synthase
LIWLKSREWNSANGVPPQAEELDVLNSQETRAFAAGSTRALPSLWRPDYRDDLTVSFLDQPLHAAIARITGGFSPTAMMAAYADWAQHLVFSPDKQLTLMAKAWRKWFRYAEYCGRAFARPHSEPCITPLPQDRRFADARWQEQPFAAVYQAFLLTQQWWHNATTGIRGVSQHHEDIVSFVARQVLDTVSPANFPLTNPTVLTRTFIEGGANFARGAVNWWQDWFRLAAGARPLGSEAFQVGRDVAVTPGKVVFRNRLIELIQYAPASAEVFAEPVLIVPAWIMKYYILDLSPGNSLVKYLVNRGHTVFLISWKNPTAADRDLGLADYHQLGIMAALDAISTVAPKRKVHGVGYCIGGTLLAIAAAAMARDHDDRLKSLTLLAAQVDFTEAGELELFIDDAQVSFIEDMMADRGFLDTRAMRGTFHLLRSNDLIWSTMIQSYLLGERPPMTDLMAWSTDATRMPSRMHSEYLRNLFLNNDLVECRYEVDGRPISLRDIDVPIFAVSTLADHISPWRSVYKIQALVDPDVTFVLSSGGHNAGIVSPPGQPGRSHQIATHAGHEQYVDPDAWQQTAVRHDGSWWPCWQDWLAAHSSGKRPGPSMGAPAKGYAVLDDAPGTYVFG